jgi:hypothetical protein
MTINSSSSIERFALAPGEFKSYETLHPGGCIWSIDLHGDDPGADAVFGTPAAVPSATVKLQTSEDNTTYSDVGSAVTVVAKGQALLTGTCGQFSKIINTGATGIVWIVAKPMSIVQAVPKL